MIYRGVLTDAVLAAVATCGFPVGDAEAPAGGGWQGEPNKSDFVPYTVLTPMASASVREMFVGNSHDVSFTYSLTSYGVSRKQCEHMADAARQVVTALVHTDVGTGVTLRRVQDVMIVSVGQVSRIDSVEPAYYAQTDTYNILTSQ